MGVKKCPPNLMAPLIKIVIEEIRKVCKKEPLSCGFVPSDNGKYNPVILLIFFLLYLNRYS
ncbi:hypothetical protein NQ314_003087 [Rhamnusium bicolor]|uniref:Reverse transcriptase n=1 Tax=Rhamnusium bicolor TaxID=1586634 RepID=A0AAV8ZP83_9CUCU|nr:hypothetical protein NQ314_003087 [Rhamnusium bicolor]